MDALADRGRQARQPLDFSALAWKDILWRVYSEINQDRILLVSAGSTFYLLLALFPFLAAFVSLYGFVADPKTIAEHIAFLGGLMPSGGMDLIRDQLQALIRQDRGALGFGFLFGLAFALWSANSGVKALFDGLNIAYEEDEKRSFLKLNLVSLGFTLGAIVIGIGFIVSVGVVPAMLALLRLDHWTEVLVAWGRWPVMFAAITIGIALLFRFGPSRAKAKLRWLSWGAVIAAVVWILASLGFSFYLQNFADYNATYGTLGAVIGFMVWVWISVIILLAGAELNAEMEHQTEVDTTTGRPMPMGERGARMADTLGPTAEEQDMAMALKEDERVSAGEIAQVAVRLSAILLVALLIGQLRSARPPLRWRRRPSPPPPPPTLRMRAEAALQRLREGALGRN